MLPSQTASRRAVSHPHGTLPRSGRDWWAFAILFALLGRSAVQAQGNAEEILVNEYRGTLAGSRPVLVCPGGSKVIAVWEDYRLASRAFQHAIFAQQIQYPARVGPNLPLTSAEGFAGYPDAVILHSRDRWLMAWQEYSPTITSSSILLKEYDTSCVASGRAARVSDDSLQFPILPRVAAGDAHAVVVWQQSAGRNVVLLRTYDDGGNPLCDPSGQNSGASLSASSPTAAMQDDGSSQTVWIDKGTLKRSVVTQRNTANGFKIGANRPLGDFERDLMIAPPEIAALPDGRMICAWVDGRDTLPAVYVQFLDADGLREGPNIRVSGLLPPQILSEVALSVNAGGEILVAWETSRDLFLTLAGQWIDLNGVPLGINIYLVRDGGSDSRQPSLASTGNDIYLAWLDNRYTDQPHLFDLFVKRLVSPTGTAVRTLSPDTDPFPMIRVFPNPFGTSASIQFLQEAGADGGARSDPRQPGRELFVVDLLGRNVLDLTGRLGNLPLVLRASELPAPGLYILQYKGIDGMRSRLIRRSR